MNWNFNWLLFADIWWLAAQMNKNDLGFSNAVYETFLYYLSNIFYSYDKYKRLASDVEQHGVTLFGLNMKYVMYSVER